MLHHSKTQRRGLAIIEISAASIVLIVCFGLLAQLLFMISRQERAADARQAATIAVANELETLLATSFADLKIGEPKDVAAPVEVLALIPNATLKTQVRAGDNDWTKQIQVQLTWRDASGEPVSPISLTAWKHRPRPTKEDQP